MSSGLITTLGDLLDEDDRHQRDRINLAGSEPNWETIGDLLDITEAPPLDPRWRRDNYSLRQFVQEAWSVVESFPFVSGWHIDAICDHAQAALEHSAPEKHLDLPSIQNLLINIPPRCSKSTILSVLFPAYTWITWPECPFLYVSYNMQLALRDAQKSRMLMQSNWYQSRWGDQWKFTSDQAVKTYFLNSRKGYRVTSSTRGQATGWGGQLVIGDDVHAAQEDHSTTRADIESAKAFWRDVIPSRSNDPSRMVKILVGQRIAPDDISEMIMKQRNYDQMIIPMEFDEEGKEVAARSRTALGYRDPRFETGDVLLQPDRFTPDVVAELKLMKRRYIAQYQQNPTSEGQTLFQTKWWRYFDDWPDVEWFDQIIQSWDFRFKDEKTAEASYVAGHIWAKRGPDVYLLDRYFEQSTFTECLDAVLDWTDKWPTAYGKLVEGKANGPAIVSILKKHVTGLVLVNVGGTDLAKGGGNKYQRAEAFAWIAKAGNAYLPNPLLAPWVNDFVHHMFRFPSEPNDDGDATSQAWRHLMPMKPKRNRDDEAARRRQAFLEQKLGFRPGGGASNGSRTGA